MKITYTSREGGDRICGIPAQTVGEELERIEQGLLVGSLPVLWVLWRGPSIPRQECRARLRRASIPRGPARTRLLSHVGHDDAPRIPQDAGADAERAANSRRDPVLRNEGEPDACGRARTGRRGHPPHSARSREPGHARPSRNAQGRVRDPDRPNAQGVPGARRDPLLEHGLRLPWRHARAIPRVRPSGRFHQSPSPADERAAPANRSIQRGAKAA